MSSSADVEIVYVTAVLDSANDTLNDTASSSSESGAYLVHPFNADGSILKVYTILAAFFGVTFVLSAANILSILSHLIGSGLWYLIIFNN
ncbi:uncharacterized protein ASCRUDRAFT_7502 [Ascoidea rubescens DSM 1968]|uniref:Uncharacterized protein n=1 Tax=Ascoidea rubescens DSM 1968 TaxID=1344418 RepID=A0A1D2VKC9_9ASCO|nr:hypothetical protein ASCRUDRAFT_7502 [Ascoidea rubescens DSM 1968]ODV62074.1 hypothetical protein ASCRUDRAFT_7502 [Ascoidea rubescens DSM 1968]